MKMEQGLLYLANGSQFVQEATLSAESAKSQMPEIPIAIKSTDQVTNDVFDLKYQVDDAYFDGRDRIHGMFSTPFEKTLYVDSDIYFADDIQEMFSLLSEFDLGLSLNGQHFLSLKESPEDVPNCFPEYNGGVILYNNSQKVRDFQKLWIKKNKRQSDSIKIYNQPSLREALYHSNIRYITLPRKYNCILLRPGYINGNVKLFHGRLNDEVNTYGATEVIDMEEAVNKINSENSKRVYYQSGNTIEIRPKITDKVKTSVYCNGIVRTFQLGFQKVKEMYV